MYLIQENQVSSFKIISSETRLIYLDQENIELSVFINQSQSGLGLI